jgi:serine protease Do
MAQVIAGTSAKSADAYRNCQQAANAVVTLYSGAEIGAGSIVDADGTILTALHVVKEAVKSPGKVKIYVKLANGHRYLGRPIASDTRTDLALVQIPVQEALSTVPLASSSTLQSGQKVCAIGSPAGRTGVLSQGTFKNLLANGDLQSAVRLTYGNSGGPLLDAQGTVVGVNKSIWVSDRGENTGISYATSAQVAQNFVNKNRRTSASPVVPQPSRLAKQPSILAKQPITIPVQAPLPAPALAASQGQPAEPTQERIASTTGLGASFEDRSLTIQHVEPDSPAALGGLQAGDRVIAINGTQLNGLQQLETVLNRQPSTAILTIDRKQQLTNVQVNF